MAACDPVFNYIRPVITKYLANQENQITGVEWCKRQLSYVDAEVAPLPFGPKTYFYGETDEGFTKITLDYHSFTSAGLPGLIKEAVFEHEYFGETGLGRTKYYIGDDNNFWIQSGYLTPQKDNRSLINIKVGVKDLTAFDVNVIPAGTGVVDASLALIMGSGFGQMHRFKKLGGIVYHDLNTLYSRGSAGFVLGALSIASGISVSNASTPGGAGSYVNRKYVPIGFHAEKILYSGLSLDGQPENQQPYNDNRINTFGINMIFWDSGEKSWRIGNHVDDYYYSRQDVPTPNLVTGQWLLSGPGAAGWPPPDVGIASGLQKPYFILNSNPSAELRKTYEVYWRGNPLESTGKSYIAKKSSYVNALNNKIFNFITPTYYETSTPKALVDNFSLDLETKYSAMATMEGGGTTWSWTILAEIARPSQAGNPLSIPIYRAYGGSNTYIIPLDAVSWTYIFGPGPLDDNSFQMKNSTYSGILNFAPNFVKYNPNNVCPPPSGGGGNPGNFRRNNCDSFEDALDRLTGDGGTIVTGQTIPPGVMNEGWTGVEFVEEPQQLCCPLRFASRDIVIPPNPNDEEPRQRFIRACVTCVAVVDRSSIPDGDNVRNSLSINDKGEFIFNK